MLSKKGGMPCRPFRSVIRFSYTPPLPPTACSYEQPVVDPHVSHFRQVPFRTVVKLPRSGQAPRL